MTALLPTRGWAPVLITALAQFALGAEQTLPLPAPAEGATDPVFPPRRTIAAAVVQAPSVVRPPASPDLRAESAEGTTNYLVTLELKPATGDSRQWKYVTTEGTLDISTVSEEGVAIDQHAVPVSMSFTATIRAITENKCHVKLFLGRSVPYVTGFTNSGSPAGGGPRVTRSQIQQIQVGLSTAVVLESGKPLVVQDDDGQRVTVTLTRLD